MAYNVEFTEPTFDAINNMWILVGFLRLEIEGEPYRTLTVKHWISFEVRFNQNWFSLAKSTIKKELEDRANRETRAVLQYRQPVQAAFTRISIPNIRRIYPQLIANDIVSVQPMIQSSTLEFYANWRYSEATGRRARRSIQPIEKTNWKEEGF